MKCVIPQGKKIYSEEKNVELKNANGTFKSGEISESKTANGQSLPEIAELKIAKQYFWVENLTVNVFSYFCLLFCAYSYQEEVSIFFETEEFSFGK